jgi:hypothetical protein
VSAWRVALEDRGLGSVSINVRITAVRKLAVEAADNGLLFGQHFGCAAKLADRFGVQVAKILRVRSRIIKSVASVRGGKK